MTFSSSLGPLRKMCYMSGYPCCPAIRYPLQRRFRPTHSIHLPGLECILSCFGSNCQSVPWLSPTDERTNRAGQPRPGRSTLLWRTRRDCRALISGPSPPLPQGMKGRPLCSTPQPNINALQTVSRPPLPTTNLVNRFGSHLKASLCKQHPESYHLILLVHSKSTALSTHLQ